MLSYLPHDLVSLLPTTKLRWGYRPRKETLQNHLSGWGAHPPHVPLLSKCRAFSSCKWSWNNALLAEAEPVTVTYYIPGTDDLGMNWDQYSQLSHSQETMTTRLFQKAAPKLLTSKAAETYLALLAEYPWWMESFPSGYIWQPGIGLNSTLRKVTWGNVGSDGSGIPDNLLLGLVKEIDEILAGTGPMTRLLICCWLDFAPKKTGYSPKFRGNGYTHSADRERITTWRLSFYPFCCHSSFLEPVV